MPLTELQIVKLVERYLRERDRFDKMASTVARHVSVGLRAATIPHLPTFRAKDGESLSAKLTRDRQRHDLVHFESEFAPSILDLAGVRIMLYRPQDQDATCEVIERLFTVPAEARFRRDFVEPNGYQARHRVAMLRNEMLAADPSLLNLDGVYCEIQVVTFGDHIWNELEHDIRYKTPTGLPSGEQNRLLRVLRGQLNAVRTSVEELMEATDQQKLANLTSVDTPEDLAEVLKSRTGRRLRGDISGLFRLLNATLTPMTRADLERLPLSAVSLEAARARLQEAGVAEPDDVSLAISALWPDYANDFLEISRSWLGRPGPVARTLQALEVAVNEGRI
jgi:ppGpp synthetase/RelA/SpoT-type nucleotidyltranferase